MRVCLPKNFEKKFLSHACFFVFTPLLDDTNIKMRSYRNKIKLSLISHWFLGLSKPWSSKFHLPCWYATTFTFSEENCKTFIIDFAVTIYGN
jgi:hypothetical protein